MADEKKQQQGESETAQAKKAEAQYPYLVDGKPVRDEEAWLKAAEESGAYDVDFLRTYPDRRFDINTKKGAK